MKNFKSIIGPGWIFNRDDPDYFYGSKGRIDLEIQDNENGLYTAVVNNGIDFVIREDVPYNRVTGLLSRIMAWAS